MCRGDKLSGVKLRMVEYVCFFVVFFFFQAEGGIRGICLSRGLGDVYWGQLFCVVTNKDVGNTNVLFEVEDGEEGEWVTIDCLL